MNRCKVFSKMWFLVLLLVTLVAGCARNEDVIPVVPGVPLAPTVTSTVPANLDTGVQINRRILATFSEVMDVTTISTATFKVVGPSATAVEGTVTYAGETAVFTPTNPLATNSLYTATITNAVKSQAGLLMAANHVWSFTTGLTADSTAPKLITTGASDGDTGLPTNRDLTATFSEPMDPTTLVNPATSFKLTLFGSTVPIPGVVTYLGNTATFNPNVDLLPNQKYTATITTAAKDLAGNALAAGLRANPWSWTTAPAGDTTPPTVTLTNPVNLATNVPVDKKINASFSKSMRLATMITSNFIVVETLVPANQVNGTVAYDTQNNIATFSPQTSLTPDTSYTVTVTNGATDLAGNALVVPAVGGVPKPNPWTFRTAAVPVQPPALAINLRGAASFGIAANAGMTSTGVTVVNGDVALYLSPTCTDATGGAGGASVPPPGCAVKAYGAHSTGLTVNGSVYFFADPFDNGGTANSVKNDLNIAWVEGKNMKDTFGPGSIAGEQLAGKTLITGIYHEANLGLSAGGLVQLDAQNDPTAIFIFKVDSTFNDLGTTLLPSEIRLIRGAQARNVWFVVGLDATIGHGTTWNGNILAGQTVTVLDGSTVNGRILAGAIIGGSGAINLTGAATTVTTITVPQ